METTEITTRQSVPIEQLIRAEEQGLDLNRLLFVKYLVASHRISDDLVTRPEERPVPLAA